MKKTLNIGLIGTRFMGKAHAHAWLSAPRFFALPYTPVLKAVSARDLSGAESFAQNWGFDEVEPDWRKLVARPDIDVIDICTPTARHYEMVLAAAQAGKHIFCEKPCAMSVSQAEEMAQAADRAGCVHYLNHNYRRVPAVALAKQMIDEGTLGELYHWQGTYLQDWLMDRESTLNWRLQKEHAGAGAHYDLGSHCVDLALYLAGEIESVSAMARTFTPKRPLPGKETGAFLASAEKTDALGGVTVDDALFMTVAFAKGALGTIDTSRMAGGRKNYHTFALYGSKGSLLFNQERMNELVFNDLSRPEGFRTIQVTESTHPYMAGWWAPGHIIGYGDTFIHAVKDFVGAVAAGEAITPNLWDGVQIMRVLEAGLLSARENRTVEICEIE